MGRMQQSARPMVPGLASSSVPSPGAQWLRTLAHQRICPRSAPGTPVELQGSGKSQQVCFRLPTMKPQRGSDTDLMPSNCRKALTQNTSPQEQLVRDPGVVAMPHGCSDCFCCFVGCSHFTCICTESGSCHLIRQAQKIGNLHQAGGLLFLPTTVLWSAVSSFQKLLEHSLNS